MSSGNRSMSPSWSSTRGRAVPARLLRRLRGRPGLRHRPRAAGRESEVIFQIIQGIRHWESLRGGRGNEEVGESIHFVGPEKEGAAYRLIVVRKRNDQRALLPDFEYIYRLYVTNTDWNRHKVVRFYRKRGDAENVIRELKEGMRLIISSRKTSWPMRCSFNSSFSPTTWLRSSSMYTWTVPGGGCGSNSCATGC